MDAEKRQQLTRYARELRKNATKEENHLWYDFLKGHALRWHRQMVVGGFILDFYCDKAKLAIELDGAQHYEADAMQYDADRTIFLQRYGIEVLRFTNAEIRQSFEAVCRHIDTIIQSRIENT